MISKTREGAKVFSRQAKALELDQHDLYEGQIKGVAKIGSPTVDSLQLGVEFPNVQSAIEDIANSYQVPISGVSFFMNDQPPGGTQMVERITVIGTAAETFVEIYGIKVKVNIGDNQNNITTAIKAKLDEYKANKIAISDVTAVSGAGNQLDVKFIDTNNHVNYQYLRSDVKITGATSTRAVPGYGTWTKLGHTNITDTEGGTTQVFAYRRIS